MKQTMTIHQGLCELKIINNRIQDSLREYVITPNRNNNEKIDGMTIEEVKSAQGKLRQNSEPSDKKECNQGSYRSEQCDDHDYCGRCKDVSCPSYLRE